MNNLGSLKQGGDGKRTQNRQDGDKMSQFPLPIIWIPSYDKPEEVERKDNEDTNVTPKSAEEPPSNFQFIPLRLPDRDDSTKKPRANEEKSVDAVGSKMMEKNANRKGIPVKQMEPDGEMDMTSEDSKGKVRDIPVLHIEDNGTKKPSESSGKRQSSSPPKMSKLPPVCLRIDPLPRSKNGQGSSRSPSPPCHRGNPQEIMIEKSKVSASTGLKENSQQDSQVLNCAASKNKDVEPSKTERKVIKVAEETGQIPINLSVGSHEAVSKNPTTTIEKSGRDASKHNFEEGKQVKDVEITGSEEATKAKEVADNAQSVDGECKIEDKGASEAKEETSEKDFKAEKKNLSDTEATVIIQSAYRGFEVRRWEPLRKLKQIAAIRKQVDEVRSRIQALESSSDLWRDDKQRVVLGETIMSLLLKLDTIQGLHPGLRDIRKSVARELTSLQEKLDSLIIAKSEELIGEVSTAKFVEGCADTHNDVCMQGEQDKEAKEIGYGDNSSESSHDNSYVSKEPHQSQSPHMTHAVSGSQGQETTESLVGGVHGECENKIIEIPMASDVEPRVVEPEPMPIAEPKDELADEKLDIVQPEPMPNAEPKDELADEKLDIVQPEPMPNAEPKDEKLDFNQGVMMETQKANCEYPEINKLQELQKGVVVNEKAAIPESEKCRQVESMKDEALQVGELEQIETGETEILHGGEVESNAGISSATLYDEALDMNQPKQQPQGVHEEVQLSAKLEESVTVDTQNDENVPEGLKFKPEAVELHGEVAEAEEAQPAFSLVEKEGHDEEQEEGQGIRDVDQTPFSAHANTVVMSQEEEVPVKEVFTSHENEVPIEETKGDNGGQLVAFGEKEGELLEEKAKSKELESEKGNDISLVQPDGSATAKDDAVSWTQFAPVDAKQAEEEAELLLDSSKVGQISVEENVSESDKKLIEENEKLRDMMEKLLEAGKEQLTVISNLSKRVKDLERKLSRKKKLRTRRYGAATSRSSCVKTSNDSLKQRAVGCAM
ncbi:hypothetical protein L1049_014317 [Liquidambar formosana]|uniref:BAG domain-containing protein n=1 Tax=Liquidambar formosana TaxID=63359 RepID=A0AAP0RS19_LIQFO